MILKNRLIGLILFCLCYSFYSHGQNNIVVQWKKNFGGERNNTIKAVIEDDDGNIVLAGESQNEANQLDVWLLKINPKGETIWTKTFPKKGHQSAFSIEKTETGFMVGANDVIPGKPSRPFILFVDNDGNTTKRTEIHYAQDLNLTQLKTVGNYIYAVGTTIKNPADLFTYGILIKFNKDFNTFWEMKFKGDSRSIQHPITKEPWPRPSTSEPRDFLVLDEETLVLTGYQSSDKVTDFWTVNVDIKNQKVRWESKIGEHYGGDEAFQLIETPDKQILMVGTRYDKKRPNFPYRGQVIKFDKATGKVLLEETYEAEKTLYFDRILKAFPAKNGNFLIGLSGENPYNIHDAVVQQDIWLVFIDHDGKMLWQETIPQIGEERGINFLITAKNEYFIFAKIYQEDGTTDLQVLKIGFP